MRRHTLLAISALVLAVVAFAVFRTASRHQAAQALDQAIDQFVGRLPPGTAFRHGAADYNPLTSALTIHDVAMTRNGATVGTADLVTISGTDGRALQDVFDSAAYPNGHPAWTDRRLLIADASAEGVHLTAAPPATGQTVIGYATLHRLTGRPFMLPPTRQNRIRPDFQADAGLALAVDTFQAHNVVLSTPTHPGNDLKILSTVVSDYDGGKLGSFAMKTMTLDTDGKPHGSPTHAEIAAIDIKSLDLRSVLEAIRRSGHANRTMLSSGTYASFNLSGMSLDVTRGPHLALRDMHATQGLPDHGVSAGQGWIHGLTVGTGHTPVAPAAAALLAAFGMNAVTMDIDAASQMQPGSSQAGLREDIVIHDLGTLHLQASVSGYDAARASPAQPLAAVLGATIDRATVVYEDHSLTNRLLAMAAVQMHSTPDVVRAQLAMPIVTLGLMLPEQPDASDQMTAFLNHPGTLTVMIDPPQKTTLAQLAQAPVPLRPRLLGLHITAK